MLRWNTIGSSRRTQMSDFPNILADLVVACLNDALLPRFNSTLVSEMDSTLAH